MGAGRTSRPIMMCPSALPSVVLGSAASPGKLLDRLTFITPHRRPTESETLEVEPAMCVLASPRIILTHTEVDDE